MYYKHEIFIARLKGLRKDNKLNQVELATMLNKSKGTIGHWEAGSRMPDLITINKLSQLLDCSPAYLLGYSDFKNESEDLKFLKSKLVETGLSPKGVINKAVLEKIFQKIEEANNLVALINNFNARNGLHFKGESI